ncbi:hypothetical protein B0H10DRAFT_1971484 [Mycena sp. CBHHK59/15]|nr:hypothetical protein B0H10DRAFT_1971484 [Mycena sp. CBHHK59/15]
MYKWTLSLVLLPVTILIRFSFSTRDHRAFNNAGTQFRSVMLEASQWPDSERPISMRPTASGQFAHGFWVLYHIRGTGIGIGTVTVYTAYGVRLYGKAVPSRKTL